MKMTDVVTSGLLLIFPEVSGNINKFPEIFPKIMINFGNFREFSAGNFRTHNPIDNVCELDYSFKRCLSIIIDRR